MDRGERSAIHRDVRVDFDALSQAPSRPFLRPSLSLYALAQRRREPMLECTACNRQFFSTEALIQHTEAKHGKTTVHRGVRAWEDSRNQRGELTTGQEASACTYEVGSHCYDYDTEMWECEICYRQFYGKRDLEQHLNSGAHEAELYRCQGCQRTFRNLGALNQHVTATDCSQRAARQVRTLLSDAQRQPGLLQLTDRSFSTSRTAPAEGTLYFDGGATPNPGLGGAGYRLLDDRSIEVARCAIGIYPYHDVTNNQAEYIALIQGMIKAQDEGMKRLVVKGDSEVIIKQMAGQYQCLSERLVPLNEYAKEFEGAFMSVRYEHIPRTQNTVADSLASLGKTNDADYEVTLDVDVYPPIRR